MSKTVYITGWHGFVGRHLTNHFRQLGWIVHGCDIATDQPQDMRDGLHALARADYVPDLLIHCAANVGGRVGIEHAQLWQAENYELDRLAIQWAHNLSIPRVIYFSSSAVYPVKLQVQGPRHAVRLLAEKDREISTDWAETQGQPDKTYGRAKLQGEHLVHAVHSDDTQFTIFRPFSGYGPGQSDDYPMTSIVRRALKHPVDELFQVWGPKTSLRDWVHIDDICHAVSSAVDMPKADTPPTYNIATGRGTSFEYLAQLACVIAGRGKPPVVGASDKPTGCHTRVGDPTLLNSELWAGHTPLSLEEGVYQLVKEYSK